MEVFPTVVDHEGQISTVIDGLGEAQRGFLQVYT